MLNFNILLVKHSLGIIFEVLHTPGHVRVFLNDFIDHLNLSIMEVCKVRLNVILFSLSCEWWEVWMTQEMLEVAELIFIDLSCVDIILVLLS